MALPSILTQARAGMPTGITPVAPTVPAPAHTIPKPNFLILGDSGTGKTSSFRNMPWDETTFVDSERKGLSWDSLEYPMPSDLRICATADEVEKAMFNGSRRNVVLDSLSKYIELVDSWANATFSGHEVWAQHNLRLQRFFERIKSTKQTFICTAIPEILTLNGSDGTTPENMRRVRVRGKGWEGNIEKEFAFVLCTTYKIDMKAQPVPATRFYFQTASYGINRAKTPIGVFKDMYIDNDVAAVLRVLEEREARVAARVAASAVAQQT